jgi:hypothetical protein
MNLPADEGISLIKQAIDKEIEERAWQLWVSVYPHMEKEYPFEKLLNDIKSKNSQEKQPQLTAAEVIEKAERIRMAHRKGAYSAGI